MPAVELNRYIQQDRLTSLFIEAKLEDLGPSHLDLTSQSLIPEDKQATASFQTRTNGILAGCAVLPALLHVYDPDQTVVYKQFIQDGAGIEPGQSVATLTGPLRTVLSIERVALNTICHLSGIATLTSQYAQHCQGTRASIYDTRKTLPGLRGLQKYAVACGGGKTHRMGLYDAVLIKDNHLAHLEISDYGDALKIAIERARAINPKISFAMVEVDTHKQLQATLPIPGVDLILLDNMPPDILAKAVAMRDSIAPQVELEASGGITLETVEAIAQTDVDRISVGALTHSAPNLDLGLDIVEA